MVCITASSNTSAPSEEGSIMSPMDGTVWLLTEGSYSEYHVVGVYATEALALAAAAIIGREANEPEEVPVRTSVADLHPTWYARVPKRRRSGEPTVSYSHFSPHHREPDEPDVAEKVTRDGWFYLGRDRGAVEAAARAQAQALHGVVLVR